MNNLIDIKAAADILKLKSIYHARTLLGNPDDVEFTVNNKPKHLYSRCRVCALAQERVCLQCQRNNDRGKRSCYQCKRKFSKCELTSGICPECQAEKIIKNFICHGDCCKCPVDCHRLEILSTKITKYQSTAKLS